METFNGRRDVCEAETVSSFSQSRVSASKAGKGQQIAQQSQAKFGGMSATGGSRRTKGMVQFADERGSPPPSPDFARGDKDDIRVIDEALAGGSDVDMFER